MMATATTATTAGFAGALEATPDLLPTAAASNEHGDSDDRDANDNKKEEAANRSVSDAEGVNDRAVVREEECRALLVTPLDKNGTGDLVPPTVAAKKHAGCLDVVDLTVIDDERLVVVVQSVDLVVAHVIEGLEIGVAQRVLSRVELEPMDGQRFPVCERGRTMEERDLAR